MKIYTKTGDKGATQIYTSDMLRVSKSDMILDCYGTLDELNSHIGLLAAAIEESESIRSFIQAEKIASQDNNFESIQPTFFKNIQLNIFAIGFAISDKPQLEAEATLQLEEAIDQLQLTLPAQTKFILPGGSVLAAQAHVARTVARRAERQLVALSLHQQSNSELVSSEPVPDVCLSYVNRLSDYLFVVARVVNKLQQIDDIEV
ncbi:cob(I)yrinic acid a,c-diamide adenosyltransferase [Glaciecola sp. MH2013]|uniref:cob(I)yrinic acid a,c-diamide adenosyltransferase n=1 Tax=Glaciecola sp. MH2013 TaxID=2785524 RepID=UPI00189D7279|nr:cob(I)yrinic acid a,c-diamide adenosyltransferase [Glaciecola sp. MH2013]MBF7072964.1 cob(I)yrinic acid a,c-diamide adenosyltransferase [Glaciecola sp. MH2013]